MYYRGSNAIRKHHFTLLYSRARELAFTARNIRSGWTKAGLFLFNPNSVLGDMPKPAPEQPSSFTEQRIASEPEELPLPLHTTTTATFLSKLRCQVEDSAVGLDDEAKWRIQKLANAAEHAFA